MQSAHAHVSVFITLKGLILRETDKAIQFQVQGEEGKALYTDWFPKSQINLVNRSYIAGGADKDSISVAEWILKERDKKVASAYAVASKGE